MSTAQDNPLIVHFIELIADTPDPGLTQWEVACGLAIPFVKMKSILAPKGGKWWPRLDEWVIRDSSSGILRYRRGPRMLDRQGNVQNHSKPVKAFLRAFPEYNEGGFPPEDEEEDLQSPWDEALSRLAVDARKGQWGPVCETLAFMSALALAEYRKVTKK